MFIPVRQGLSDLQVFSLSSSVAAFLRNYALALLLAALAHFLLFAALWSVRFSAPPAKAVIEPVMTYFYQPDPVAISPEPIAETIMQQAQTTPEMAIVADEPPVAAGGDTDISVFEPVVEEPAITAGSQAETIRPTLPAAKPVNRSLAERALQSVTPSDMDMAYSSYQQFRQQQQQPKITVEKRHQALSQNPQQQVMMTLDNGMQLIRTKEGCRLADPGKDGFEALMAARKVPCGDEVADTELLKQILSKHIKR